MSDNENNDSKSNVSEGKMPMEISNKGDGESKVAPQNEEISTHIDSPPPSEPNSPTKTTDAPPNKSPIKSHERKSQIEDEDEEEEEELPPGLLERPVIIETGTKRERKKTDRLPVGEGFTPTQKKKVEIPEGRGTKLGGCPRIEYNLQHRKVDDFKLLHKTLFNRQGQNNDIKKNIRLFCGFAFDADNSEYKKRMTVVNKLTMMQIKSMCEALDLEKKGQKTEVVNRLMTFLLSPAPSGKALPKPKHKRSRSGKKTPKNQGEKRKRSPKKEVKPKKSKEDVESDDEEDDDDERKESTNDDGSDNEDVSHESESEKDEEVEPPKKKKLRTETPKKGKTKKEKKGKENGKKDAPKKVKKTVEEYDDESSSDDGPLSKMSSEPPDNNEIKEVIKKILDGADLEEVTMKTVVKQVYAKYPSFDLSDKKDFIKSTVKDIIS